MRFTVIMPVYNAGEYLRPAIESILRQTYEDFELLIIDDGSSDGSADICDAFTNADNRIRTFHRTNSGICKSRNFGIQEARGEYLTFCDHDDLYSPVFLKTIENALSKSKTTVDIVKVNYDVYDRDEQGRTTMVYGGSSAHDATWCADGSYEFLSRLTSMAWDGAYRRAFLLEKGISFDETFTCGGEDADFSLRCVAASHETKWVMPICYRHFTNYGASTSSRFHAKLITDYLRVAQTEQNLFPQLVNANRVAHFRRWLAGLQNFIFRAHDNPYSIPQMASIYTHYMRQLLGPTTMCKGTKLSFSERILLFMSRHHLAIIYGYSKAIALSCHLKF